MGAGVATVGRRQYAVGLYWENSPTGRLSQTAREAAKQPGQQADFYAIRPGNKTGRVPQFGLGLEAASHKAGMPAFAGCMANQQPGSWCGAFRLREGTVVTVVRDDLVVPDGDQFFLNESEARDRLLQEVGFGGLQRVYAPESWSISGADSMPVSLLMDERRDVRLSAVRVPKKTLYIGVAVAFVLVLVLGGGWYYQEQQAQEEEARNLQEDALRRLREQASSANPFQTAAPQYPLPERKWESHAQPLEMIDNCRQGLVHVPAQIVGWRLSKLACSENAISIGWARDKGFMRPPEGAEVSDDGSQATAKINLPTVKQRGPENLVNPDVVTRRYLAQDWPGTISRAADDPPPPPPPNFQGQWTPPSPPWVKRSFTVTVPELPSSLSVYFGELPGVVIESADFSGGSWTIKGVIYENRT